MAEGTMLSFQGLTAQVPVYLSRPDDQKSYPAVIVIHEIWGLSDHIRRVADRLAGQGFVALAPNLFDRPGLGEGMTGENIREAMAFAGSVQRERLGEADYLQSELAKLPAEQREKVQRALPAITGGINRDELARDLVKAVDYARSLPFVNGKVGSVGFCFGGGMSFQLATLADYQACAVFYGDSPNPLERVQNIPCPVLGIYGADDMRINSRLDELVRVMVEYHKDFEMRIYAGAAHAFFNETSERNYRESQARDAWQRLLAFFRRTL